MLDRAPLDLDLGGGSVSIGKRVRYEVLRRCNFACFYCGLPAPVVILEIDHLHPKSRGGSDDEWNLVAACQECNAGKLDGVPDPDTIDRARSGYCAYVAGREPDRIFCTFCRLPIMPECPGEPINYEPMCHICGAAYDDGFKDGRESVNA